MKYYYLHTYLGVKMEPQSSPNNILGHPTPGVHPHQQNHPATEAFGVLDQHQGYYHGHHHHHHQIHQRATAVEWNEHHQLYPPELRYHHTHMIGQQQQQQQHSQQQLSHQHRERSKDKDQEG